MVLVLLTVMERGRERERVVSGIMGHFFSQVLWPTAFGWAGTHDLTQDLTQWRELGTCMLARNLLVVQK